MLDINRLREDPAGVERRLQTRDSSICIAEILELDKARLSLIRQVEELKAQRNRGSQQVADLKKEGKDAAELIASLSDVAAQIAALDGRLKETAAKIDRLLCLLPNVPHADVPVGTKEERIELRRVNEPPRTDFPVRPHLEIAEAEHRRLPLGRLTKLRPLRRRIAASAVVGIDEVQAAWPDLEVDVLRAVPMLQLRPSIR